MVTKLYCGDTRLYIVDTRPYGVNTRLYGVDTRLKSVDTRLYSMGTRLNGVSTSLVLLSFHAFMHHCVDVSLQFLICKSSSPTWILMYRSSLQLKCHQTYISQFFFLSSSRTTFNSVSQPQKHSYLRLVNTVLFF